MGGQYAFEKTKNTANILALYGPPFALSTTKRYHIVFTRLIPSFYIIFFINNPDDHKMINAFANSILESYNENPAVDSIIERFDADWAKLYGEKRIYEI